LETFWISCLIPNQNLSPLSFRRAAVVLHGVGSVLTGSDRS
jgi:hypothetical protein